LADIDYYVDSGLAVITLADSSGGNLLNGKSLALLHEALRDSLEHAGVRAVLLRSNGARFCLGMDLGLVYDVKADQVAARNLVTAYSNLLLQIHSSPKPVLALVTGEVKAGGVGLTAVCDIVIASEQATFEFSEVLWGLIPANVLPFLLSQRLSPQQAGYLILTGKKIDAEEARSFRLVDEVFSNADLERGAKAAIKKLFRASPQALAEAKSFIQSLHNLTLADACREAQAKLLEMVSRPEVKQAVAQYFAEGELPAWVARFRPQKPLIL
jgi:enoyl-CoA hydratase/carnithine racemase